MAYVFIALNTEQLVLERLLLCKRLKVTGYQVLIISMTRSIVVSHLQKVFKEDNVAVACIYCNYKEQTEQTVPNLVASLLKQLVQDHFMASDNVKSLYKDHQKENTFPKLTQLIKALQSEIETYSKVFVIADALDECSEYNGARANLLKTLQSLDVNLMVTSRDLSSIGREFQNTKCVRIHASDEDVQRYIEGRIPGTRIESFVSGNPTLQDTIVAKVIQNVRGM
jgi:hypothetical protein